MLKDLSMVTDDRDAKVRKDELSDVLSSISPVLYVDIESINLERNGTISIIQL